MQGTFMPAPEHAASLLQEVLARRHIALSPLPGREERFASFTSFEAQCKDAQQRSYMEVTLWL